jgi:hypothetical protein
MEMTQASVKIEFLRLLSNGKGQAALNRFGRMGLRDCAHEFFVRGCGDDARGPPDEDFSEWKEMLMKQRC